MTIPVKNIFINVATMYQCTNLLEATECNYSMKNLSYNGGQNKTRRGIRVVLVDRLRAYLYGGKHLICQTLRSRVTAFVESQDI